MFRFNFREETAWNSYRTMTSRWAGLYWKKLKLPLVADIVADLMWKGKGWMPVDPSVGVFAQPRRVISWMNTTW